MELKNIKDLFTVNAGLGDEPNDKPQPPVFKKRSIIVWIMPWHWIAIPIIRSLKKQAYQKALQAFNDKVKAFKDKVAARFQQLHKEYSDEVTHFITDPSDEWTEQDLEIINGWAEQVDVNSHHAISKETMAVLYKSKLFKKIVNKLGYELSEVSAHAPAFIWGYDYENGWVDRNGAETVSSIVNFRFFLYTPKQIIVATYLKDFYNSQDKIVEDEIYYKAVAGIKTVENTVVNQHTKEEITSRNVILTYSGDKVSFPVVGADAEDQVKSIKQVLNTMNE